MTTDETHLLARMGSPAFGQQGRPSQPYFLPADSLSTPPTIAVGNIRGGRSAKRPSFLEQTIKRQYLAEHANMASLTYGTWAPFASGAAATSLR